MNKLNERKEKKMDNKGFSLVELIIVIAIMAVLIGVLAPQYMRYVERSRVAVDRELASSLQSAMTTALLDPMIEESDKPGDATDEDIKAKGTNKFWTDVYATMGVNDATDLNAQLKSNGAKDNGLKYTIKNGTVVVSFTHAGGTVKVPDNGNDA